MNIIAVGSNTMKEIRKNVAIKEGRDDTNCTLVRNAKGHVCVKTFSFLNKPFVRGRPGPTILPNDFACNVIVGRILLQYVDETWREIKHVA